MKFAGLLGLLLSTAFAAEVLLEYPRDIKEFSFSWKNEAQTNQATETGPSDPSKVSDKQTSTGEILARPKKPNGNSVGSWGDGGGSSTKNGMEGNFIAKTLAPGIGNKAWSITAAKITFDDQCMDSDSTVDAYYTDLAGNRVVLDKDSVSVANGLVTFTVEDFPTDGVLTRGPFDFHVKSNKGCEGDIEIREIELKGTRVATDAPTPLPTTATPTESPTKTCKGEFVWGDPHYFPMAMNEKRHVFNFQGYNWYYYLFPCDLNDYANWPFFLLSRHDRWRNSRATIIVDNRLILNTQPKAWVLEFTDKRLKVNVGSGVATGSDVTTTTSYNKDELKKYSEADPLKIEYDDTKGQSGTVHAFIDTTDSNKIVLRLYDMSYGDCDGLVIDVRNSGYFLTFSCPTCLRNLACGLGGKYIRGDCTRADLSAKRNGCDEILQGSDGTVYNPGNTGQGNSWNDNVFKPFAKTWYQETVEDTLKAAPYNVAADDIAGSEVAYTKSSVTSGQFPFKNRDFGEKAPGRGFKAIQEGRAAEVVDYTQFEGECYNNSQMVMHLNTTCREHTWGRYKSCCEQIGYCDMLWEGCFYDMCWCDPSDENACLGEMVHASMNSTCSYKALYPTATPTSAPTRSPTGIVGGLPKSGGAGKLIWLYLIFVVLFIVIAGAAYWYYRKKSGSGKAQFNDEETGHVQGGFTAPQKQGYDMGSLHGDDH